MTPPSRMTPDDSAFWHMESDVRRMHGVTLVVLDGPHPGDGALRNRLARCVAAVPRFRQRVVDVPLRLGRPMWVDDPEFDIDDHFGTATASDRVSLGELVSLIVSQRLDRSSPLWQLTSVTGLGDGRWALVSKVHHSMIDGLYGTEPLAALIDGTVPEDRPIGRWAPRPLPRADELVGWSVGQLLFDPAEQYRFGRSALRRNRRRLSGLLPGASAGSSGPAGLGLPSPPGGTRAWASVTLPLEPLRKARRRYDASLHELVMVLVTSGLREWLRARDEGVVTRSAVEALVPVAIADPTAGFAGGISAERISLPVGEPDLERRLELLPRPTASMSAPAPIEAQIGLSGLTAPTLASLGLREAARQGAVGGQADVLVLNVPGPRQALHILGRQVVEIDPVMPLVAGAPASIGVYSYLDRLTVGVTTDRASIPDVGVIVTGIRAAYTELTGEDARQGTSTTDKEYNHADR